MMKKIIIFALSLCCYNTVAAQTPPQTEGIRVLLVGKIETILSAQMHARIQKMDVKMGDSFKRGDKLIEFDCRLPNAELSRAEAQLKAARKTHEANLKLEEFKAVSTLEVALAEADVLKTQAEVTLARAQVSLCDIRAPFNGKIISVHSTPYASVGPGVPLIEIIDDSQLEMQLHVPSIWREKIRNGIRFKVHIEETATEYQAEIIRIGAKIDAVSQTLEVGARILDKDKNLLAGMSGSAYFE
jgi:membrane fusion protein, multidrug efflux system